MNRNLASVMALLLFMGTLALAFNVSQVKADGSWVWVRDTVTGAYGEAVVGTGTALYIARGTSFYGYLPANDSFVELAGPPKPDGYAFKTGTALAWDFNDYIYALCGAATGDSRRWFYRYGISSNSWETLANTTADQGEGNAMTRVGIDNNIYATIGGEQRATYFMRYDPSTNSWSDAPADPPDGMGDGSSLVWTGGEHLYALRGEFIETSPLYDFWRYSLTDDAWTLMTDIPALPHSGGTGGVGDGGSLLYAGFWLPSYTDYIYALSGNQAHPDGIPDNRTYRYTISTSSWERLADFPFGVGYYVGCRLGYADGHIYAWQGAPSTWTGGGDDLAKYRLAWIVDDDGPADFRTIKEAVSMVIMGSHVDTVYVKAGTYNESYIEVVKGMTLIGENRNTTIIDGKGADGAVIAIKTSDVCISGFTIRNPAWGTPGIYIGMAFRCSVGNNLISSNSGYGIDLYRSSYNALSDNIITLNNKGIRFYSSSNNSINNNIIWSNGYGVYLEFESMNNTLNGNTITNNTVYGISLAYASRTSVYHNNFINNAAHVTLQDASNSTWDDGSSGNFWSDYNGTDLNGNGIGDTPYTIDANNQDRYPLIVPAVWNYSNPIPVVWAGAIYPVALSSNSTISGFKFNQPQMQISFNVTGPSGTVGYCNVTIQKTLLADSPWTITIDDVPKTDYTKTENGTHTFIYFTYTHASTSHIVIQGTSVIPEFPKFLVLPLLIITTLLTTAICKRRKRDWRAHAIIIC